MLPLQALLLNRRARVIRGVRSSLAWAWRVSWVVRLEESGNASAVKTHTMGLRIVVGEEEPAAAAYRRLAQRMVDGGVFDEIRLHSRFESHWAKRHLKRMLKRERSRDRAAWEGIGVAVQDFAQ